MEAISARISWEWISNSSLLDSINEINLYGLAQLITPSDPREVHASALFQRWLRENAGATGPKAVPLTPKTIETVQTLFFNSIADTRYHLRAVEWQEYEASLFQRLSRRYKDDPFALKNAANPGGLTETLARYFAGELAVLDTLPVAAVGTPFQQQVWLALRQIPCGTTTSYGELAAKLGRPTASRAVGMANGSNPISIVVPCHRLIGANGALTGYAGGVQRKA